MLVRLLIVVVLCFGLGGLMRHVRARPTPVVESSPRYLPRGVFHLAPRVSEFGLAAADDLATRAHGVGLDFIVLTDRDSQLAGPLVRDGVVVLSYAETVTERGSLVVLGAAQPLDDREKAAPLDAADGRGLAIITRPTEPHRAWDGSPARAGGVAIASVPATARREAGASSFGLVPLVLGAQWNKRLAAAQLYRRDDRALALWDTLSGGAVGVCEGGAANAVDSTRELDSWQLVLDAPLPEAPDQRPSALLSALTRGAFHCATGLFGEGVAFEFGARSGNAWLAHEGDTVRDGDADELVVVGPQTSIGAPRIDLYYNGERISHAVGRELHHRGLAPGHYRAEVSILLPGLLFGMRSVPIVYSNRIRVVEAFPPKRMATTAADPGPWDGP